MIFSRLLTTKYFLSNLAPFARQSIQMLIYVKTDLFSMNRRAQPDVKSATEVVNSGVAIVYFCFHHEWQLDNCFVSQNARCVTGFYSKMLTDGVPLLRFPPNQRPKPPAREAPDPSGYPNRSLCVPESDGRSSRCWTRSINE